MSGGHYDYKYFQIQELADHIETDFLNDGKILASDEDDGEVILNDLIFDATDEQKKLILKEVKDLIQSLKNCSKRAKELEWYLSSDIGIDTYLQRIRKISQ